MWCQYAKKSAKCVDSNERGCESWAVIFFFFFKFTWWFLWKGTVNTTGEICLARLGLQLGLLCRSPSKCWTAQAKNNGCVACNFTFGWARNWPVYGQSLKSLTWHRLPVKTLTLRPTCWQAAVVQLKWVNGIQSQIGIWPTTKKVYVTDMYWNGI